MTTQKQDNYSNIVKDKSPIDAHELAVKLGSTTANGLGQKQVEENRQKFGINKIPQRPPEPFWKIYLGTFKDPTLIILLVSACVSIIIGSAVKKERDEGGYIDGIAIIVAVIVVSMVGATNDYQKEKQFRKLNAVKEARDVQVVRGGQQTSISIYDLVVGDVLVLNQGDQVLVDGLITTTQLIKFDESQMTGETQMLQKTAEKPWIVSGSLVQEGSGRMLVTAVGVTSIHGEMMLALGEENDEDTPLQQKLNSIVKKIGYLGIFMAVLTFLVLIIKFFVDGKQSDKENYTEWISFLILGITIIVVAIPEGLPLAVTISLAYSMKKMLKDQCLVRKLNSCETCGSVSVICSDKTGTLTKNEMHATHLWNPASTQDEVSVLAAARKGQGLSYYEKVMCLNTSFTNNCRLEGNKVIGAKTTGAFLMLSRDLYECDYERVRAGLTIGDQVDKAVVHQLDFSSERKRASMLVDLDTFQPVPQLADAVPALRQQGRFVNMIRGASEIMLQRCVSYLDPNTNAVSRIDDAVRNSILDQISSYANKSMRTLICAYKSFSEKSDVLEKLEENMESELVFVCLVGIKDPLRDGVPGAIETLRKAGIRTIMVTGDNFNTAVAISKDANIIARDTSDADILKYAIEGKDLRQLSDAQLDEKLKTLCCVARCQPTDKYRVVKRLKFLGNVVAATGDGSNDAPQLKEADVGLAMGIAGTEIAKEASDIVILDDNFCSIVQAVRWGRAVLASVRKFIQFQVTVNIVALVIAFIGSAAFSESPLTSIQLLYVNLIMDSLGSLALATEGPTKDILDHLPVKRSASIITPSMLRNILGMAAYQLFVLLIMLFNGLGDKVIMTPSHLSEEMQIHYRYTSIYNFFIFAQILNEMNSRKLNSEVNIFEGYFHNLIAPSVLCCTVSLQCVIMFVPGIRKVFAIFDCSSASAECGNQKLYGITWQTWLIDIAFALGGMILHLFMRMFKCKDEFEVKPGKKQTNEKERKGSESLGSQEPPGMNQTAIVDYTKDKNVLQVARVM
ncbi:Calcium-transporting_ATPase [Hexamita inflata]|uniref:Calcium-transporting ATPase n=1 Tax=Hexamita inflata TaxID=28002 RepID=A0AA86UIZ4_9EUKA|nr:Calcium-transporting ATPase [Hexamita inflata]